MEKVSVPKPETREVCTACGQVDGYHLQKCRISELQAEVEMLRGEVVNRNQRALDGDKATAAFNAEYERAEQHRIRAEQAEQRAADLQSESKKMKEILTWVADNPTNDAYWIAQVCALIGRNPK